MVDGRGTGEAAPEESAEGGPARGRSMSLELLGQRLSVVSEAEEAKVREIVDFVNRRLEAIRDGTKRVQIDQIALLAALNLAEELFAERERSERLRKRVRERSVRLLASIDAVSREIDTTLGRGEASGALDASTSQLR